MIKKYLPYLLLLAAAGLLYWVSSHQRGKQPYSSLIANDIPTFIREKNTLSFSEYSLCLMRCFNIDSVEVTEVLNNGTVKYDSAKRKANHIIYPLEGYSHHNQHIRALFVPHSDTIIVASVWDLDRKGDCFCK